MTENEYYNLLEGNKFKDNMIHIFNFFEPYCDAYKEMNINELNEVRQNMRKKNINIYVKDLGGDFHKNSVSIMKPYINSLSQNVNHFMGNKTNNITNVKWKKILYSYINVSRAIIDIEEINLLIQNNCPKGEQLVFAGALVKIEEDDIKVNDEIDKMVITLKDSEKYFVFPSHGCSTDVFKSLMKKYRFDIIHLAGHCGKGKNGRRFISFSDSNMLYATLCKEIKKGMQLVFLNCCSTYEYVNKCCIPNANRSIVHKNEVVGKLALKASIYFYTCLNKSQNIDTSWDEMCKKVKDDKYYFLR